MRLAGTVLGMLLLLTTSCSVKPDADKAPPIKQDFAVTKITDRVYVIHGPKEFPNKKNQGFMNNPGFVLTDKGVVVVDPGSSVQAGEMVLQKIAGVTKDPVIAVFNTHIHGDHWLGNHAIKAAFPKAVIYAHPKMIERVKAGEGESWVKLLDDLTEGATRGTKVAVPDIGIEGGETLKLRNLTFRVYHNGKAHTDADILIEVVEEKAIFLGDNVVNKVATRMDDSDIKGQIKTIDLALKTPAKHYIPGHGQSGGREVAQRHQAYLKSLHASVKKYYDQGLSDFEMKPKVVKDLSAYKDWARFDDEIGRAISMIYLQVEAKAF